MAGEKRSTEVQLSHYAPYSKDVDGLIVGLGTKDQLRRAIPPSPHIVCEGALLARYVLRRSEIYKFQCSLSPRDDIVWGSAGLIASIIGVWVLHQEVFRLDVSVHQPVFVSVADCRERLPND